MLKPDSLRKFLTDGLVDAQGVKLLERDPDKLAMFIDRGRVAAREAAAIGFEWRYTLNLVFQDWPHDMQDAVMLGLMIWLRTNQPDLLANAVTGNEAVKFEADLLGADLIDLSITVELNEAVTAAARPDHGYNLVHVPEPDLDVLFDDVPVGTLLTRFYMMDSLVLDSSGG